MHGTYRRLLVGLFVTIITLCAFWGFFLFRSDGRSNVLTIENLPSDAVFVHHVHTSLPRENEAERVEMLHYARPQDHAAGGPIYGVYGYRIVAIEYEIPASKIDVQPIGEKDPGFSLAQIINEVGKSISYDHFHIGIEAEDNRAESEHEDFNAGGVTYDIHFMLISHEEEMDIGLECG